MTNQTPDKLEIFLALAHRLAAARTSAAKNRPEMTAETEKASNADDTSATSSGDFFSAINEQLTEAEAAAFERLESNYQAKTDAEKAEWRELLLRKIGTDEQLIDGTVHPSRVADALGRENAAVRKIVGKKYGDALSPLEKTVRRAFAGQFVALRDLTKPTAFDYLGGGELARLIRLAGIREVALACVRIEAVEAVAAFLRTFPAEDARAVAAQLNGLRNSSETRLDFAENLVQTALEIEPQPAAMLDSLGIRLLGIALCGSAAARIRYINQKMPLEAAGKLPELIGEECRRTPDDWQRKINIEIERLAATLAPHAGD